MCLRRQTQQAQGAGGCQAMFQTVRGAAEPGGFSSTGEVAPAARGGGLIFMEMKDNYLTCDQRPLLITTQRISACTCGSSAGEGESFRSRKDTRPVFYQPPAKEAEEHIPQMSCHSRPALSLSQTGLWQESSSALPSSPPECGSCEPQTLHHHLLRLSLYLPLGLHFLPTQTLSAFYRAPGL